MYALTISTNPRNKEPKKQGPRKYQETNTMKQNTTRGKKSKHKTQKITKGGEPGAPVLGKLLF